MTPPPTPPSTAEFSAVDSALVSLQAAGTLASVDKSQVKVAAAPASNNDAAPVAQKAADFKLKGEGSMLEMMTEIFTAAIHTAFPMAKNIKGQELAFVQRSNQPGCDYQCNNAMNLFKALSPADKPKGGPISVGKAILACIPAMADKYFAEVTCSGFYFVYHV